MSTPVRIKLRRIKGWRKPEGAVVVARPSKWGNPISWKPPLDRTYAVRAFDNWLSGCLIQRDLHGQPPTIAEIIATLRGKDLCCWCALDQPCHADVLLEIANR
jgi:hypothetical protein